MRPTSASGTDAMVISTAEQDFPCSANHLYWTIAGTTMPETLYPGPAGTSVVGPGTSARMDSVASKQILRSYPRSRPSLSEAHRRIYVAHYLENREGNGALTRLKKSMEAWMHRRVAARQQGGEILEIGAGTLNHVRFEPKSLVYDAVEPFRQLWEGRSDVQRLRNLYDSLAAIPEHVRYDRIFSIAVLEHLTDLPGIVAQAGLHLRPDGCFQAGIPSEGGFLWGLAWRLTTGISFRLRTGLPYSDIMRHEHVNTSVDIIAVCSYLFEHVVVHRFPTRSHHFSFYAVIEAHGPRIQRCRELLGGRSQ